ncbi:Fc.00g035620.m01.CDS01 [Cosmosporella sp. VM-42]
MSQLGPPFLAVSGVANFRDIGGTPISRPGHVIKSGVVYRSAEPSRITDEGISTCQTLEIAQVYDLRSTIEIERHNAQIRTWPNAERVFVPLFTDKDYSPEAIALRFQHYSGTGTEGFVEAYRTILDAGSGPFGKILSHLAEPDPSPVLIHCTAGKDRTGVICAVILSLCGVDDNAIAQEYQLTEIGLGDFRKAIIDSLMRNPALEQNPEGANRMLSARPENLLAALVMLRQEYGSVEKYVLNHCGLSPDDVAQIRRNLIVNSTESG